jgi:hypothetical protein
LHSAYILTLLLITPLASTAIRAEEKTTIAVPHRIDTLLPDDHFIHVQTLKPQNELNKTPINIADNAPADNAPIKNERPLLNPPSLKEDADEKLKFYLGSHLQPSFVEQFSAISAIVPTDKDSEKLLISPTLGFRFYISPHLVFDAQTDLGYFKFSASDFQNLFDAPSTLYLKDETVPLRTDATLKFLF